jgi:hypothetical protein
MTWSKIERSKVHAQTEDVVLSSKALIRSAPSLCKVPIVWIYVKQGTCKDVASDADKPNQKYGDPLKRG